jgi:hypothetical protein
VANSPDIVVVNDPYNGSFFIDIAVPPSNNTEIAKYMVFITDNFSNW